MILCWLGVAFFERYDTSMDTPGQNTGYETYFGNKTRAAGKGFAHMAVRCLFLAIHAVAERESLPAVRHPF